MSERWWDTKDFDDVVGLAVTELYQDSRDQLITELEQGALHLIVADTLRNVHFMEIRDARDRKAERVEELRGDALDRSEKGHRACLERCDRLWYRLQGALKLLREAAEEREDHDMSQDPVTLVDNVHRENCFLCRLEAFLASE